MHNDLDVTVVYVTHDQEEALTLSTRIAVMNNGIIEQYDTPTRSTRIQPLCLWRTSWVIRR